MDKNELNCSWIGYRLAWSTS